MSCIHTEAPVGQWVCTSRTEFGLGDPADPGSSLDLVTAQLGDSGMKPAPQFLHLQMGTLIPVLSRLPLRVVPERSEKMWDGGAISKQCSRKSLQGIIIIINEEAVGAW